MQNSTEDTNISLAREFQKHLSDPTRAHGLLDHVKDIKCDSKWKWTGSEYHYKKKAKTCNTYWLKFHVQQLSSQHCHFAFCIQNLMD